MSVLIKDMEMPETCDDCPFHVYHSHYEYVCKATPMLYPMNLANTKGIRKEWCPLIEQEDAPTIEPEPKWIPCSDRLPEYNEVVLTWDGHMFCIEKRIPYIRDDDGEPIEGDWWVGDEYDEYESDYYPNLRDGAAIAWMPLPEPYREEGAK